MPTKTPGPKASAQLFTMTSPWRLKKQNSH